MVFHSAVFRGHAIAQTFFFYHFLPVFVFLIAGLIKVVLHFARDLQLEILQPLSLPRLLGDLWEALALQTQPAAATDRSCGAPLDSTGRCTLTQHDAETSVLIVTAKFFILVLLCVGVVLSSTVLVRFLFDSLPSKYPKDNHAKMRKNFAGVIWMLQRIHAVTCMSARTANRIAKAGFVLSAATIFGVVRWWFSRLKCGQCYFAAAEPSHRPGMFWNFFAEGPNRSLYSMRRTPSNCAPQSDQSFYCEVIMRSGLIAALCAWQWAIVWVSVHTRPNKFRACNRSGARESDGNNIVAVVDVNLPFSKLMDVLLDDANWEFVVRDACYAGMLMSVGYLAVLTLTSEGGLMYALAVFLTVASGQSAVYAGIWFLIHWVMTITDSCRFMLAWMNQTETSAYDCCSRKLVPVFVLPMLIALATLVHNLYGSFFVLLLVFYSLLTVLPVLTFILSSDSRRRAKPAPYVAATASTSTPEFASHPLPTRLAPLRYKVYWSVGSLIGTVLVVILAATLQRIFMHGEDMPHSYHVTQFDGTTDQTCSTAHCKRMNVSGMSITLQLQNITFASGHVLLHHSDRRSGERVVQRNPYCSLVAGVSLAEYAFMTQLAYLEPFSKDFERARSMLATDFELIYSHHSGKGVVAPSAALRVPDVDPEPTTPSSAAVSHMAFVHMYSQSRNVSVIAVRGTTAYDLSEWLADIDVWVDSASFQLFSKFLPGLSLWPTSLVAEVFRTMDEFVHRISPATTQNPLQRQLFYSILRYARRLKAAFNHPIVIAGHSLGGGIAKLVGSLVDVPAVSLSGPGIVHLGAKLGIPLDAINRNVVNVIPSSDWVARIGKLGGTIHHIVCEESSPWHCHFPMNTACNLIQRCGHPLSTMECIFEKDRYLPSSLAAYRERIRYALSKLI